MRLFRKILFMIGVLPFVIVLCGGIYSAIIGYSPIYMSAIHYGWDALMNYVFLWSYLYWPSYLIGILLIILSILKLKK